MIIKADKTKLYGIKIKIYPSESQKQKFNRFFDLYRFCYNWAINEEEENYKDWLANKKDKKFISLYDLYSGFSKFRSKTNWLKELPLHTAKESIKDAYYAYIDFFKGRANHPKFKSKKVAKKKFQVRNENNAFYFKGTKVKIPGLPIGDLVECKNHPIPIGDNINYYNITISSNGYEYWLSVNTEVDKSYLANHEKSNEIIGIDVGFRKFATLSNGKVYYSPNTRYLEKRIRRQRSRLSKMRNRRYKESIRTKTKFDKISMTKNEEKLRRKYIKTIDRLKNINYSFVHQTSAEIANLYPQKIVMEDLRIESLKRNHFMATQVATNPSLYQLRFQLAYKCKDRGIEFKLADVFFPSTQICSNCGKRHKVYKEEIYICPYCGFTIDRDLNAALNLSHYNG